MDIRNKSRIEYYDLLKGFGIILMVMGHVGFGSIIDKAIHAFHMPMFFIISGMLIKPLVIEGQSVEVRKKIYTNVIKRKSLNLLVPYFIFGIIHYVIWFFATGKSFINYTQPLIRLFSENTTGLVIVGALWFLTALYFAEIIYYFIQLFVKDSKIRIFLITIIGCIGCLTQFIIPATLPWALSQAFVGCALIGIGFHIRHSTKRIIIKISNMPIISTLLLGLGVLILIVINEKLTIPQINMRLGNYGVIPLFWINAIGATLVGLSFCKLLTKMNWVPIKFSRKILAYIGKNSIIFVCLNQIVILIINKLFIYIYPNTTSTIMKIMERLLILAVVMVILCIINFVMERLSFMNIITGRITSYKGFIWFAILSIVLIAGSIPISAKYNKNKEQKVIPIVNSINRISKDSLDISSDASTIELEKLIETNVDYIANEQWKNSVIYAYDGQQSNITGHSPLSLKQKNSINSFVANFTALKENQIDIPCTVGEETGENAIRPLAHTSFILSNAYFFDLGESNEKENYRQRALSLVSSLSSVHASNYYSGWGDSWQSALWSEQIGFAAWLLWDDLSDETRIDVTNMILNEANRLIEYTVPYYGDKEGTVQYPGDTKGEENAWNSRVLALVSCMFPTHPNKNKWENKMNELLLSSSATLLDANSLDILNGYNINNDGTVVNHGKYHVDYMSCIIEGMIETAIIYKISGQDIPTSSIRNIDLIYEALVNNDLGEYNESYSGHHFYERTAEGNASSETNMPSENDWGGKWLASYYLNDVVAGTYGLDNNCPDNLKAVDWEREHFDKLKSMIMNTNESMEGAIFKTGEDLFVSGETYGSQNLMKAYLIKILN